MNYIYDLMLNFNSSLIDFYEWEDTDKIINVSKIPIFRINSNLMDKILNSKIKISNEMLNKVCNKTKVIGERGIKYSFLVSDLKRVIGLKFNNLGECLSYSSLLLDEEESVIDEVSTLEEENFSINVLENREYNKFLTRKEIWIRDKLIKELVTLYKNRDYAVVDYLYNEIYKDKVDVEKQYNILLKDITDNYSSKYNKLYEIIAMI